MFLFFRYIYIYIYKNYLEDELLCNTKLFPDDTLFSVVKNVDSIVTELNNKLAKINS